MILILDFWVELELQPLVTPLFLSLADQTTTLVYNMCFLLRHTVQMHGPKLVNNKVIIMVGISFAVNVKVIS